MTEDSDQDECEESGGDSSTPTDKLDTDGAPEQGYAHKLETGEIWGFFQYKDREQEWECLEKAESLMHLVAKTIHTGYGYAGETTSAIKRNKGGEWEFVAKIFPHLNQGSRVSWYKDVVQVEDSEKSRVQTFPEDVK